MITVSSECGLVLAQRSYTLSARASISYAGETLLTDIPIVSGGEEFDDSMRIPERVTIRIPRIVDGRDLVPTEAASPIAPYGQRLHVKLGVGIPGTTEWINRGEFLTYDVRLDGTQIAITAVGLLDLIDEARLVTPYRPTGTFLTSVRNLVEPALTVLCDADLLATDRSVPGDINQDEDRLGALDELLAAWPARAQVTPAGYLRLMKADTYDESAVFLQLLNFDLDSEDPQDKANVLEVGGSITRDGLYNTCVVRGQGTDGLQVQGVAYDRTEGSPTSLRSAFNPLPVPFYYFSPLLTTQQQCETTAAAMLARRAAALATRVELTVVPDPRTVGNELVLYRDTESTWEDDDIPCVIEKMFLPYTSSSGPMQLTLREHR